MARLLLKRLLRRLRGELFPIWSNQPCHDGTNCKECTKRGRNPGLNRGVRTKAGRKDQHESATRCNQYKEEDKEPRNRSCHRATTLLDQITVIAPGIRSVRGSARGRVRRAIAGPCPRLTSTPAAAASPDHC